MNSPEINKWNKIFVDQAPNAIAMFDRNMTYLAASQQWISDYNLFGREIIGHSHYEIFPEIGEGWKQIHQECLQGAINRNESAYFLRADKTEQWIKWDVRPWYVSENEIGGLLMYTENITSSKLTERQLQISEAQFRGAFEHSATGMAIVSTKGKWLKVNNTVCRILGYTSRELMSLTFQDITHPEDLAEDEGMVNELLTTDRQYYQIEKRYIHKNGRSIWAILAVSLVKDVDGKPLYFISQITDITKQKTTEEKLKNALSQLEILLDASTEVSIIGTDTSGMITTFNKGAENLLGYTEEEMVLRYTPEVLHLQAEIEMRSGELSMEAGERIEGFEVFVSLPKKEKYETREWTYVRKDGSHFPVQQTVTVVKDQDEIIGYLVVGTNISEIKNVEKEIKSLLEVSTGQNERLKNFAHIVSHNLKSHSANISMLLDVFLEDNSELAGNELIQLLQGASDNLKETIAQLTEIVLMNASVSENLVPIEINTAVKAAVRSVAAMSIDAGVAIINDTDPGVMVSAIPAYLDSILLNLITNGIKYRSAGTDCFIRLTTVKEPDYLVVTVTDNGLGMDMKKVRPKLFGMYKTFHGNSDAKGMGLFITRNQVEAIGGRIEVESEVNKGTTFKVYFKYGK